MTEMLLSLNGEWEVGPERKYDRRATVPGLATDPSTIDAGQVWYRRLVELPAGDWSAATLTLNGARFCPAVYVNGEKVSQSAGGMAPTEHLVKHAAMRAGSTVTLEVALTSLRDVDRQDASRIPNADLWRSNVSCCLWDAATLRLHGEARIVRLVPFVDVERDVVTVAWNVERVGEAEELDLSLEVVAPDGAVRAGRRAFGVSAAGRETIPLGHACECWSPRRSIVHRMRATLSSKGRALDRREFALPLRDFRIVGKRFHLNGKPVTLRAATVVWPRWCRDPEARELAFDAGWFEQNIARRLKAHGANALRFHLGMPPESFLDLCDRIGLTWLWNGLRGGLIAPAADMELQGMRREALLATWTARGADAAAIREGRCIAYELAGYYAFSERPCEDAVRQLRQRVKFLADDAPALAASLDPRAPLREHDLGKLYAGASATAQAEEVKALASCGKSLFRSPVVEVFMGPGRGKLLLSQLLTAGRLASGFGTEGLYGVRADAAAQQFVLNMIGKA